MSDVRRMPASGVSYSPIVVISDGAAACEPEKQKPAATEPQSDGCIAARAATPRQSLRLSLPRGVDERFSSFATRAGIAPDEARSLAQFSRRGGVSLDALVTVGRRAETRGGALPAMKAYAVAYRAVQERLLSADNAQLFSVHVLPHLLDGSLSVLTVDKTSLGAAQATYNDVDNAVRCSTIVLGDLGDRSLLIHELTHAAQDSRQGGPQLRRDSEAEAYQAQAEYILRERGAMVTQDDGSVMLDSRLLKAVQDDPKLSAHRNSAEVVFFAQASANLRAGRNDLNRIFQTVDMGSAQAPRLVEIDFRRFDEASVAANLEVLLANAIRNARSDWATANSLANTNAGVLVDPDEVIVRSGI